MKVQRVARMGIDAQRSGTSEPPDRAVEVRRGRIAYPLPSGCPGTPWYARREFWAGQLAEEVHSSAQRDEGDPGVDRRGGATEAKPAFWAVQPSPNGRRQSPARPMRLSVRYVTARFIPVFQDGNDCSAQFPPGCGGTWTAVPRLRRGRGQAAGPSGPAAVAATGGSRRSGSLLAALDDAHRHRLRAAA